VIGRPEIQRLARAGGVDERTQERDYVLAWLLAGMAVQDFGLVLKGGTCLRRCHIPGYRYSGPPTEVEVAANRGHTRRELDRIERRVRDKRAELSRRWNDECGTALP
jgi:hypothetical protein